MPNIEVTPLGAGQDVGKSCILVTINGKNIMLDCGMHMGFDDERRFPDFKYITDTNLNGYLDCVLISHFHLDHCGSLPFMSEVVGFDGPIFMTHPTKAICPILLEDYRKVTMDKQDKRVKPIDPEKFFTSQNIKDCIKKVKVIGLHQTIKVDDELEIKAYYAGHVLGACMFLITVGSDSVLYTGDYNMTADRHLGAAWVDKCRPTVLITESTYATTIRDSKRAREQDFLKKVHEVVDRNGKILIPVFALGRAQELCILLESYWDRMNIKAPIYFSLGLVEKANHYYKLFIPWTSQKIKSTFVERNLFEFKYIKPFDRSYTDNPGPMVVFASPGMLHAGQSLNIFKNWAHDANNMVIMPGYCVAGTIGHQILNNAKQVTIDGKRINVNIKVEYMSFSAHADAKGIMQLISNTEPKNVLLVHGENDKMNFLKRQIEKEFKINCFKPANGESASIETFPDLSVNMRCETYRQECLEYTKFGAKKPRIFRGAIAVREDGALELQDTKQFAEEKGLKGHKVRFTSSVGLNEDFDSITNLETQVYDLLKSSLADFDSSIIFSNSTLDRSISLNSHLVVKISSVRELIVSWPFEMDDLGQEVVKILNTIDEDGIV